MNDAFFHDWHAAAFTTVGLFWMAFWAFAFGYLISSLIQVFVTEERMRSGMGKENARSMAVATGFGFISSSCSFAALSTTRSLFAKGAGIIPALAFLLASTNLVIELGIVIALFLSWQFVVGEYVGGILLILAMWLVVRLTLPKDLVEKARERAKSVQQSGHQHQQHAEHAAHEHQHHHGSPDKDGKASDAHHDSTQQQKKSANSHPPLKSAKAWHQVASRYTMEWGMVWRDVAIGFTVAGVIAVFVPPSFFQALFLGIDGDTLTWWQVAEHALIGPVAAFFTFIGSMGNIPLAAVLYGHGVSFAGIMAFIFSDLVVLPVLRIQAKYYGWPMALYILGVFLIILMVTALILHAAFAALGYLPQQKNATDIVERSFFSVNYTLFLNAAFVLMTAAFLSMKWFHAGRQQSHQHEAKHQHGEHQQNEQQHGGHQHGGHNKKGLGSWILSGTAILALLWLAIGLALPLITTAAQ